MHYVLLILALLAAALSRGKLGGSVVYGFSILMLFGYASSANVLKRLRAELSLDQSYLFSGEEAQAKLTVANPSRLPLFWLFLRQDLPPGLEYRGDTTNVITLGGRSTRTFTYTLGTPKRGVYSFGSLIAETGDVLGLFTSREERRHNSTLVVYPYIHPIPYLLTPSRIPFGNPRAPRILVEDPAWIKGVRPYNPGDPLTRVNWKSSAHSGHLQVKELQPAVNVEAVVILNIDRKDYPSNMADYLGELAIEAAASIISELSDRRYNYRLYINHPSFEALGYGKSPSDLPRFLRQLAIVQLTDGTPFDSCVKAALGDCGMGSIIYMVTPEIDNDLMATTYSMLRLGLAPTLVHACHRERPETRAGSQLKKGPVQYLRAQRGLAAVSLELV